MGDIIDVLTSPEECDRLIENVRNRNPELAMRARKKAVELRAAAHGGKTDAEREAIQAVYAYEEVLTKKRGKRTRASRTWQMIKRHGVILAVERAVNRPEETMGYKTLVEMGMQDYAFEAVILRHPHLFSEETVRKAESRVNKPSE